MARWMTLALTVALLAGSSVRAQIVLATYGFELENDPAISKMDNATFASYFSLATPPANGLTEAYGFVSYGSKLTGWDGVSGTNGFAFTITPVGGMVDITQVRFNLLNSGISSTNFALAYQIGIGAFQSFGTTQSLNSGTGALISFTQNIGYQSSPVTLLLRADSGSALTLSNLNNSKFSNNTSSNYSIEVTGSVQAVPEPGSIILTGLALAGSAGIGSLRRRRGKSEVESTEPPSAV